MRTIHVNRFGEGMTNDPYAASIGEFTNSRQFDFLSYPNRLYPLRGMATSTANTGIKNLIVLSDGSMIGQGVDYPSNPTLDMLYQRIDYGNTGSFLPLGVASTGDPVNYNLLVEYTSQPNGKTLFHAGTNKIYYEKPDGTAQSTKAVTFTTIGQGYVCPVDDILYIPYTNTTATYIASYNGGTDTWNLTALTLPKKYTISSITSYGDYLAIACYSNASGGGLITSVVFMWNRDTSVTTVSETIPWGAGRLQVLNNLNGVLIGISNVGTVSSSYTNQDYDSLVIKAYSGGTPQLIKEISVVKQTTTVPTVTINPLVNFIYRNRMYFSADIVGGSTSPSYKGLWVIGKSKITGRYVVGIERFVTADGTDASVLACAIAGDYVAAVHTAAGTLTFSINNTGYSTIYANTSFHETAVNPEMPDEEKYLKKKLLTFAIHTLPLLSGQQIVVRCRVDSTTAWSGCPTIFTKTDTSPDADLVVYESQIISSMNIPDGRNFEFRIESTIGAIPVGYSYKYKTLPTNI